MSRLPSFLFFDFSASLEPSHIQEKPVPTIVQIIQNEREIPSITGKLKVVLAHPAASNMYVRATAENTLKEDKRNMILFQQS